jgi:hypothetical protein
MRTGHCRQWSAPSPTQLFYAHGEPRQKDGEEQTYTLLKSATFSVKGVPMLVIGLGFGALASQLGAVTVSAAPEALAPEVGGIQNTASQFGASLGTALAGSVLIASLTASFVSGIAANPDVPSEVKDR